MLVVHTIRELRQALSSHRDIAFVPTMGNLHEGHLHLVEIAKTYATCVVVSIFVNPLQFGQNEDIERYPRTLERDLARLHEAGAEMVFAPTATEMYPKEQTMRVIPSDIAKQLCGAFRPTHFEGVATVVMKLFHIVFDGHSGVHTAVFGKKDFQQLFIIREMIEQFALNIQVVAGRIVREADGLAMSSRNAYLSPTQRQQAPQLQQSLAEIANAIRQGNREVEALEREAMHSLTRRGWEVDYISVRSSETLQPPAPNEQSLVVLGAARLGGTRLIDHVEL